MLILSLILAGMAMADEPDCTQAVRAMPEFGSLIAPLLGNTSLEEVVAHPWVLGTIEHTETCPTHWDQLACPHKVDRYETLETPESGFYAKAKMLLGQDLPPDFLKNGDPNAPLDFSKAPKLKAVYVSTLVFRGDFYGTVMARLLKYQAEHGADVHVITTGYMMLDKDRKLLEPIAAANKNFHLDEFVYKNPSKVNHAFNLVTDKYRDMHVKLFVTLSADSEENNAVVFGGRNIHDGFLFRENPDHSAHPELVQYGKGKDDDWVHWNDFEAKITSRDTAEAAVAQLQRLLDRDKKSTKLRPFTVDGKGSPPEGCTQRHFISVPYADDHALEKQYVELLDGAKKSIRISSPYLRPTKAISDAIKRASKRGVEVTIQTRVELKGDTQAWLYEEVNKESINALYKYAKIYKWTENSILHSKFLLIDGKKAMIGSVNLSRRSFINDIENGFVFDCEEVGKKMEAIFDGYVAKSQQITEPLPRKKLPTAVIKVLENQF